MSKNTFPIFGMLLVFMALAAVPARANQLKTLTASANCQGYNLSIVTVGLSVGKSYTVNYNFALTCNGGAPVNVPGTVTFRATAKSQTVTVSGRLPGLIGTCVVNGTAQLTGYAPIYKIVINGVIKAPVTCSPVTGNCSSIPAEQGVPISPVTISASGGAGAPYTFTATGLPPGLGISSSGTISGTPTASGTFNYAVTITDAAGNKSTINCSITVNPPLQVTCSTITIGAVGTPFDSGPINVSGGTAPYTFSIGSGSLPAGLNLNTSTGDVAGTPTATGSFTINVTDALGATGAGCSITINPGVLVTCGANSAGTVGVFFDSGPLTVTGGTGPYSFSITNGTLLSGLTLDPNTGDVSGTPNANGSFAVQVTDVTGIVGIPTCPITIFNGTSPVRSRLGPAADFSILGLQRSLLQLSSNTPSTVHGKVGVGVAGQIQVHGAGHYPGALYVDPSVQVAIMSGGFSGGVVTQSMSMVQNAVSKEVNFLSSLKPTKTFHLQIHRATTISGNGAQNVVIVNGGMNLNHENLTISGGTHDSFYILVNGSVTMDAAKILLQGISPDQVLFYLPGTSQMSLVNNSSTQGTFLLQFGNVQISGGTHISEFIFGGHIKFVGNRNTVVYPLPPCGSGCGSSGPGAGLEKHLR
jgi:hypothetical protein